MPKHHTRRLARRLIILFVLVAVLVTLSANPSARKVRADDDCSMCLDGWQWCCQGNYDECMMSYPYPYNSLSWQRYCSNQYRACLEACN